MQSYVPTPLVDSLLLVAADAEEQISAFPSFVVVGDEIALELFEALRLVKQNLKQVSLSVDMLEKIERIDALFHNRSSDKRFWTTERLQSDVDWQRARVDARRILEELGIDIVRPYPRHDRYVPG